MTEMISPALHQELIELRAALLAAQGQLAKLREALKALVIRHSWQPGLGPCVCDEHVRAAALLADAQEPHP